MFLMVFLRSSVKSSAVHAVRLMSVPFAACPQREAARANVAAIMRSVTSMGDVCACFIGRQVVQNHMNRVFGVDEIAKRWKLYSVDAAPGTQEKGPDKEDISKFRCTLLAALITADGMT